MKTFLASMISAAVLVSLGAAVQSAVAADAPVLKLAGRSEVKGYEGDFDHFGVDLKGNRLFLAGEEKSTLEVFDLKTGAHVKTVTDVVDEPHAPFYFPATNKIVVTTAGDDSPILDGTTYKKVGVIKLEPNGADAVNLDASTGHLWIVHAGKNAKVKQPYTLLTEVDPATGKQLGQIRFESNFTEALELEQKGNRGFINVAEKSYVAVFDKKTHKVLTTWPIKEGAQNAPMQLDEANKRLFIVTRNPFKGVVLNTDTGATVATFNAPARTNGLAFDKANHRLYVSGDNFTNVIEQKDADHYVELTPIPTAKGAKTNFLVPETHTLFVAVSPGDDKSAKGEVLKFDVLPASK